MSILEDIHGPDDGPGKWVCRECGSADLSFSGTGTWNAETQQMDFEEDCEKPFCQICECRGWAKFVLFADMEKRKRAAPRLNRDYYGDLFVVVDDDGEPIAPYRLSLKRAREDREDHGDGAEHYRIVRVVYKALPRDDGEPDEIIDDPRPPVPEAVA
ncbi:MAG: hypothetical protein OXK74_02225 [Gemmatimonadota bacterium]|nr:hypothetical protein [Gemmatimonadota bacterium]